MPPALVPPVDPVAGFDVAQLAALPSPLACDLAAGYAAQRISDRLSAPLIQHKYSLDLIDVTHSLRHRQLFSPITRSWPRTSRQWLVDHLYQPYRNRVRTTISQMLRRFPLVVHLSVRTFPLRQSGKLRRADVGLLYAPTVDDEVGLCVNWLEEMYFEVPMLRVRRNYPRRGTTDSLTSAMRSEFEGQGYLGIEVLLNQHWIGRDLLVRDEAIDGMCDTLQEVLHHSQASAA